MRVTRIWGALALGIGLAVVLLRMAPGDSTPVRAAPAGELCVCPAGPPACDYASVSLERNDREATRIETKGKLGQFEVTER